MHLSIQTPGWSEPYFKELQAGTPVRDLALYGGRGSGKSHFAAEHLIERSIDEKLFIVCIREVQKSLDQSVKRLLEVKIEQLGVGRYFNIKHDRITTANGGQFIFNGMQDHTSDSIKSLEGYDVAWIEEAQNLSQRSLNLLRPTIRKSGSMMIWTWNPRYEDDPVDQYFRREKNEKSVVIPVNFTENPWFPEELKLEMERDKRRDLDKYAHVWLGDYEKNSEARVFKNWIVDEFEAPADAMFRFGADWGFASDPTVLIRCYLVGRKLYIDYEAYQIGCEIMDTPDLFMSIPGAELWPLTADSSRPETISHMRKNGFPKIQKAVKGKNSIREGIEWLKTFDIVVHPRCTHTISELTLYQYKVDPKTLKITSVLKDDHNHVIDALRYAVENVRRTDIQNRRDHNVVSFKVPLAANPWRK